jgi:protein-S-isoprenylcysteine O-methyltransferase Ste14
MAENRMPPGRMVRMVVVRMGLAFLALGTLFALTAGTLEYWQGWVYLGSLLLPLVLVVCWMARCAPDLMRRRLARKEEDRSQKRVQLLWSFVLFFAFVLPGLDRRFGWSRVPVALEVAADLAVLLGYGFVFLVFRANRHASAIVTVEAGQALVSTGPYALVRHHMYLGIAVMYIASPLALGSWWALLPALAILPVLVLRIRGEEAVLKRELSGYAGYMEKTRYRLMPGAW